ncbi:MAG: ATP-binding cassette domain-containing protein [Gemmatimonadetes bacterium]|nr:ATP-binding cassette domain-containing protein [Gemmatimonadota bacterium]
MEPLNGAALRMVGVRLARAGREVLRDVTLTVAPGEVCVLMGPSGAGKSTILRIAVALEPFDAGAVQVGAATLRPGALPRESALRALRAAAGMVFQQHALFAHLTALENVTLAPVHAGGLDVAEATARARQLLASLDVAHRADALPHELSGGEAQRVAIARALARDPQLLLLDEPTAALDAERRAALAATLRALAKEGRALLLTTHDRGFAEEVADRVLELREGRTA